MILPLVLISEESLEIAINAWDALFFGVAEMRLEFRIFFTLYFIFLGLIFINCTGGSLRAGNRAN